MEKPESPRRDPYYETDLERLMEVETDEHAAEQARIIRESGRLEAVPNEQAVQAELDAVREESGRLRRQPPMSPDEAAARFVREKLLDPLKRDQRKEENRI